MPRRTLVEIEVLIAYYRPSKGFILENRMERLGGLLFVTDYFEAQRSKERVGLSLHEHDVRDYKMSLLPQHRS